MTCVDRVLRIILCLINLLNVESTKTDPFSPQLI